ncbi:hypothetical protein BLNAU_11014 [Blattamonas nauphoetae]|uniref:Uncharacterized protein n=1 Tax=Blattamonas nauphoetae TaxID=2049346 RepID=A0ABQ9XNP9_9EUKA|nr:hypothetical protein BLNAU_11014 [Blattamonas nauphoetae]
MCIHAHWKANNGQNPEEDAEEDLKLRTGIRKRIGVSILLNDPTSSLMDIETKNLFNEQFNRQTLVAQKWSTFCFFLRWIVQHHWVQISV